MNATQTLTFTIDGDEGPALVAVGEGPPWNGFSTPVVTADAFASWIARVDADDHAKGYSVPVRTVTATSLTRALVLIDADRDDGDEDVWTVYGKTDDGVDTYLIDGWCFAPVGA